MLPREHELLCNHGVGHHIGIHTCDGCCVRIFGEVTQQGRDAREGEIINALIKADSACSAWAIGVIRSKTPLE